MLFKEFSVGDEDGNEDPTLQSQIASDTASYCFDFSLRITLLR